MAHRSLKKKTAQRIRAKTKIPAKRSRDPIPTAEWYARVELAASYRLAAQLGWSDMLGTHISCRVPGISDQFLINPYGMLFEEITASSLIKCDTEGNKLSASAYEVNHAGFVIHSAIHMGRPAAHAVMHLHTGYGVAVATHKHGLLPITQQALTALNEVRYHDFESVAEDLSERERLVADLGDGGMLILRNHGTLSVGATVAEMFGRMFRLERACRFQVLAMAGGAELNALPQEVVNNTIQQGREIYGPSGRGAGGELLWKALLRQLDRKDPGYAS